MRIKTNCPVPDLLDQAVENWHANRTPAQYPDSRRCYDRYGTSVSCGMLEVCPLAESVSAQGGRWKRQRSLHMSPLEPFVVSAPVAQGMDRRRNSRYLHAMLRC